MRTSPDRTPGRGELMRWLAALGPVLALSTLAAPWWGGGHPGESPPAPRAANTAVTRSETVLPVPRAAPAEAGPTGRPYVVPAALEGDQKKRDVAVEQDLAALTGAPVRVVIPALEVSAPVVPIGTTGGTLVPPGDPRTLGWWRDGARPGARAGGALITGHTVHTGGGALDDLETLRAGDAVRVRTERGLIRYRVESVRIYRKSSLAAHAREVFDQTGPGRLVLVTCEGWNGAGYDSNAVVVARPVSGS